MTQKQQPIGTGFTAASTADDVLSGIDLSGTNVIVTGGHVGLGLETTRALSKAGASVVVGSRAPDRAAPPLAGIERVEISRLDLLDPMSIDAFAARYLDSGRPLHILINGAGIMGGPLVRDARGYESQFATNHLGHFQLTLQLLPALRAAHSARVVNVSSAAHHIGGIRWDDPHFTTGYRPFVAYAQSKTANVLFAVELDRRWGDAGIHGYAVHPGMVVGTSLGSSMPEDKVRATNSAMGLIDEAGRPIIEPEHDKKTPQQGASTIVFAAASPLLTGIGGVYLKDNDIARLRDSVASTDSGAPEAATSDVAAHAVDPQSAQKLWELSEQLLKA
ncbi:SDR family NAD(P)-dependent oxidoreductase [Cryptosporangium minutisporangium]|uniref:SDR family NAD(P)-dependent oxidoreductase n=1 Tax=Cryptosporangium minutisporangium TaxID=113569 RepID=A0ABP6SYZ5_9ACTN